MSCSVFLSYSTHDLEKAVRLKQTLEKQPEPRFSVFMAETAVKVGEPLVDRIKDAIHRCDFFVLLWSPNSKESAWVQQEIGHANSLGKTVFPIVLEKDLDLPAFISHLKYLPAYKGEEEVNRWVTTELSETAKEMSTRKFVILLLLVSLLILVLVKME